MIFIGGKGRAETKYWYYYYQYTAWILNIFEYYKKYCLKYNISTALSLIYMFSGSGALITTQGKLFICQLGNGVVGRAIDLSNGRVIEVVHGGGCRSLFVDQKHKFTRSFCGRAIMTKLPMLWPCLSINVTKFG